jgi:PAS domain-containing protein
MATWFKDLREHLPHRQSGTQRTCALCNAVVEETVSVNTKPAGELPEYDLCRHCEHKLFAQWGLPFQEYLDGLEVPVVVTDDNVVLKAANQAACALLGKQPTQMEGLLGGLVFECEHALEPEGCGRTVHCSGCVIRNTVTDCHQTGTPHVRVPATLDRGTPEGRVTERLLISTLRRDNVVLLRIELDPSASAGTE